MTTRRAPRACASCRYQLQSLFDHGFTRPSPIRSIRPTFPATSRRAFSTSLFLRDPTSSSTPSPKSIDASHVVTPKAIIDASPEANEAVLEAAAKAQADLEATVRSARQTFGDTLPRDFLTNAELALYERLYGPPLRHTTWEDLDVEALNLANDGGRVSNVILRENEDGSYEEVEMGEDYMGEGLNERGEEMTQASRRAMREQEDELLAQMERTNLRMANGEMPADIISEENDEALAALQSEVRPEVNEVDVIEQVETQLHGHTEREIAAIKQLYKDMEAAQKQANEELLAEEQEDFEAMQNKDFQQEIDSLHSVEENLTYHAQDNWGEDVKGMYESEDHWGEDEYDGSLGSDIIRTHPYTREARSGTTPSTVFLPAKTFTEPLTELLRRSDIKHLTAAAEKAFGGKGLPHSAATPGSEEMKKLPQKHIGLEAGQNRMTEIEADAYMAVIMPAVYATVLSTLTEMRKRLGPQWIRDMLLRKDGKGPSILDAGAGGAGAMAWKDILQTEWDIMAEEGLVDKEKQPHPPSKLTVHCGPLALRDRASLLLDGATFLPRLPDYVHSANSEAKLDGGKAYNRKAYDVVIAPHTLFPLAEDYKRKAQVQNLWSLTSNKGGVLLLIEKGLPRGFEAIAYARQLLTEKHISSPGNTHIINNNIQSPEPDIPKETGMIIAPCTNHSRCPMYPVEGFSAGRKDFCHFRQRFIRPGFYQRVIGASHRNHEDVKFSYIAVRRGVDTRNNAEDADPSTSLVQSKVATDAAFKGHEAASNPEISYHEQTLAPGFSTLSLPRVINEPLKRTGHVTLDVCTPSGTLERWTVPKSFSSQAYRDSRKLRWGDLWALGAKTRVPRTPRLGKPADKAKEVMRAAKKKGQWKGRDISAAEKLKREGKDHFEVIMGDKGPEDIRQKMGGNSRAERRNKRGRLYFEKKAKFDKDQKEGDDLDF